MDAEALISKAPAVVGNPLFDYMVLDWASGEEDYNSSQAETLHRRQQ